jgi:hypothetical protein
MRVNTKARNLLQEVRKMGALPGARARNLYYLRSQSNRPR